MARINWSKGLFRVWLVLSALWAGAMFVDERPDEQLRLYLLMDGAIDRAEALANSDNDPVTLPNGEISTRADLRADLVFMRERQKARLERVLDFAKVTFVPTVLLLLVGWMVVWVARGFSGESKT